MSESKRRVLVTGASRGIGRGIAEQLAADGFDVTVHFGRRAEAAQEVCAAIEGAGGNARALGFDVGDRDATQSALAADLEQHGAYWGVVSNAGISDDAPFASMGPEAWDRVVRTNLDGFYNVVQPLVMPMVRLRDGGRIVVLSSVSGVGGNAGQVNYAATKAGLIGAAKSLAQELAKRKITVNAVAPGFIATEMIEGLPTEDITARIPLRRVGTVGEVASLVRYLFSDGAAYITAQTISVNGGMV
ncbi:3-oxoacyl-ACP reductase FabG [Engelhardtia mirabilis]|uniref:3-oxoacyl-[acyl-carrier-protein] reductase FabG n=1 Tax=Engelhardtia mirabilis TaxID=2528011 RepID=A0A518BJV4_9BACT|nr:3-oxoacyl-[acyl-carrier-protein] reductase FabG [Planctomycetes bacterium Pla133]QDV01582.1 3-oxoacyl-[acyl-carrier-protein] reductase FabG [Planctomycetes bacterium Pla86]